MLASELDNAMSSPIVKARKLSGDDELSTAAPTPNMGPLASPWGTPVRASFGLPQSAEFFDESAFHGRMTKVRSSINSDRSRIGSLLDTVDDKDQNGPIANIFDDLGRCHMSIDSIGSQDIMPRVSVPAHDTPPATTRQADKSPPATPRGKTYAPFGDVPPPIRSATKMPILMKALVQDSVELVKEAIIADPDAARLPFWDHEVEPPLCFAVRKKCKAEIVRTLLKDGADMDAKDRHGKTPADFLQSMHARGVGRLYADIDEVAQLLNVRLVPTNTTQTDRSHALQHLHWNGGSPFGVGVASPFSQHGIHGLAPFASTPPPFTQKGTA